MWLFVAHFTLLMVSAFYIRLARLQVASLVLVPVAKRSPIVWAPIQNVQCCTWYFSTTNHYYLIY